MTLKQKEMEVQNLEQIRKKINTEDEWHDLEIDREQPYIYIHKIQFEEQPNVDIELEEWSFEYEVKPSDNGNENSSKKLDCTWDPEDYSFKVEQELQCDNASSFEIKCSSAQKGAPSEVVIEYSNFRFVESNNFDVDFKSHIINPINSKIVFSAPFGQGKTIYLKHFFIRNEDDFEVLRIFPVNYSVAGNHDIFKYIKVDLLLQLLSRQDISLDTERFSLLLTAQQYFITHPKRVISKIVKIGMGLSYKTSWLLPAINELGKLIDDIASFHQLSNNNDFEKAKKYIGDAYEEEGSIFEDNLITQIIKLLIEELRSSTGKQIVQVIDDLDRIDPEHIFRILNVISAHSDIHRHSPELKHNKFGFDKIVLVCHIDNLEHIFHHRFGQQADFNGYINKFYSIDVFRFNNKAVTNYHLNELIGNMDHSRFSKPLEIIKELIESGKLPHRDFQKFEKLISRTDLENEFQDVYRSLSRRKDIEFAGGHYTYVLYLLIKFYGSIDRLHRIIEDIKKENKPSQTLQKAFPMLISSVRWEDSTEHDIGYCKLNDQKLLRFEIGSDRETDAVIAEKIRQQIDSDKFSIYHPSSEDYYDALSINIERLRGIN